MPWEVIGNVLLEATISEALKGGYKLFQDHVQDYLMQGSNQPSYSYFI